jgi:hypothetical protein
MEKNISTLEKALQINLDPDVYGAIAEIGAGQEVARNFFLAGGAAGTVAKSMSAYDMLVSDAIYGQEKDRRYVSQSRVCKMIDREFDLVVDRLQHVRPENTKYFAFADTVIAKGYKTKRDCHGWLGIKFQPLPEAMPSSVILHVRMKDRSNVLQQQALGILGINIIYAAFYFSKYPEKLIESLMDNLSTERIEIDMIKFEGQHFQSIDNRLMALHLVRSGLTHSVFFTREGGPIQANDLLYKKNLLVLRGSFRPITKAHIDIAVCARREYMNKNKQEGNGPLFLAELSMSHLMAFGDLDKTDFLGRVDTLCAMGFDVQISDFTFFHELKTYLNQFNTNHIAFALGIKNISEIFDPHNYEAIKGGILMALAELFSENTQLFVYPKLLANNEIKYLQKMTFEENVKYIFHHFLINSSLISLDEYSKQTISVFTRDIRNLIKKRDNSWEKMVPAPVCELIKQKELFGCSLGAKNSKE